MLQEKTRRRRIFAELFKYWTLFAIAILVVIFGILQPRFLNQQNLFDILSSSCVDAIAAIGVSIVMACGEIDYACGIELFTGGAMMGILLAYTSLNQSVFGYVVALIISLMVVACFGGLNAFLNVKVGIPAFIATMGTSLTVDGIFRLFLKNTAMFNGNWPSYFTWIGQHYVFGVIPFPAVVLVVVGVAMLIYTEFSKHGKMMYAVGNNKVACRYLGINANAQKVKGFIICAVLCGLAGIISCSMIRSVVPGMGDTQLFTSITAIMLGATFLRIGVFNVPGTIVSVIFLSVITNGLTMQGYSNYVRDIVQGVLLLGALAIVMMVRSKGSKA